MGCNAKKLTQLRRQEQEIRGYATSSHWYTGLSHAISFLERAETNDDPIDRFRDAWSAAYNLFMMYGKAGDEEFKRFNSWVTELKEVPEVRRILTEPSGSVPLSGLRAAVYKSRRKLLNPQGLQELEAWKAGSSSPDKACRYFFNVMRDLRNTCSHPDFNPNSASIKKALAIAADCLIPVVCCAGKAMIEHPVEGTTGHTTAYRSFLWPFLKNSDSFFSDYYLERLFPEEELVAFAENEVKTYLKDVAKALKSRTGMLMKADAEGTKREWCMPTLFPILDAPIHEGVRIVSEDAVFEPSCVLKKADLSGLLRKEYQGKDAGRDLSCLIWILPWRVSLDVISKNPSFDYLPVMEVANRALTSSNVPWGVITNGRQLRLLAKGSAHKPRRFLEIDLDAIADRQGDEEALLAFRYFLGMFSGPSFIDQDAKGHARLDRVLLESERHGKEIGDELKHNVFDALEELGDGFLHYLQSNPKELKAFGTEKAPSLSMDEFLSSEILLNDVYTESLSLMYRLLFLFYAESRNLLPMEDEMYRETYSLESIRDDIISVHDDPDPKRFFGRGDTILWDRLKELFEFVNHGWRKVIPVYDGGLFDTDLHEFLERFKVSDYFLARAIDLLSRTQPRSGQARGEGRKKVTYRDLDVRHLGSIYEGILEYSANVAHQDLVVMKRGSGAKAYEEYVPLTELNGKEKHLLKAWQQAVEEEPQNPSLPRGCKIVGYKEKGRYFLVYGGRKSKRKSSGSYYTPDYIVQYIVENTLGPLVRGDCRPKPEPLPEALKKLRVEEDKGPVGPLSSEEILQLKVLDPAMGSGHFLVAATEFLARAYGEALIREGKDDDGIMSEDEFIRYKRMIAERCIYGVDINPMAVELTKLSMWLFTMDAGRPLSFLNHHLKCGNSLIGAWIDDLGELPKFDKKGKPKKKAGVRKQRNLFESQFKAKVPLMIRDLFGIMEEETLSYDDIKTKKALDKAVEEIKRPFKNIADNWVATYFGEQAEGYANLLLNVANAKDRWSKIGEKQRFFHWELEFPEVWFDEKGNLDVYGGFSGIVTNPPWGAEFNPYELILHQWRNQEIIVRMVDSFMYFVYQGAKRLSQNGRFGIILPDALLYQTDTMRLRNYLLKEHKLDVILNMGDVFEGVTRPACIIIFENARPNDTKVKIGNIVESANNAKASMLAENLFLDLISQNEISLMPRSLFVTAKISHYSIWSNVLNMNGNLLSELVDDDGIQRGVSPDLKKAFLVDSKTASKYSLEKIKLRKVLTGGKHIKKFFIDKSDLWLIYTTREDNFQILPNITSYIDHFKHEITCKEVKEGKHPIYSLHRPRQEHIFLKKKKIVGVITGDKIIAALDRKKHFVTDGLYLFGLKEGINYSYVLGILNSALYVFLYQLISSEKGRVLAQVKPAILYDLPIPKINHKDPREKSLYDGIVESVELIIKAGDQITSTEDKRKRHKMLKQISEIEDQIDFLVYDLCGLNKEEISLIERTVK